MRRRPIALTLCALVFLYFPISWGVQVWRGHPVYFGDVLFSLILPALLLVGLMRVVRVGWYTLIAFGFIWGARDLYIYYSSQGANLAPIVVHLFIYLVRLSYFINPRVRHLYFDPRMHWWKTKQRFETHMPTIVRHQGEWFYPIMRNISEGGCFWKSPRHAGERSLGHSSPLPEPLNVPVIKARGEIRWVSKDPLEWAWVYNSITCPGIKAAL
ncbi:MAG: PilZ domain-containing protein [Bdellovibrionota bacterium]